MRIVMSHKAQRRATLGIATVAALFVAGCSSEPERQAPTENIVEEQAAPPVDVPAEPEAAPPPKLPEPESNIVDALPADEPVGPDQQMLDDADATGLTARTTRSPDGGEAPAEPADEAANQ